MTAINTMLGTGFTSNPTLTPSQSDAVAGIPNGPVQTFPSVGNVVSSVASGAVSSVGTALFFSSRFAAIILGLIFIAGALLVYVGEDVADALGVGSKGAVVKKVIGDAA